ncbi:MAG: 2-succinyl-6-hydroxy-2,4-cyclohexadiene-1-carboxylate synthase [Chloroflexi bacterium]|nr:2-succinyl-6-hydroxy-2,4-cyclohexadiene-1-carboxylate synthase [Chloroflexota bacterium]
MSRIAANGVSFNVDVRGEGPALLLLHGFTGSSATWTPYLDAWRGFTAIAVDLLGHGESDAPPDPHRYTMERCIEDLSALLDELDLPRAAVLGYSMGGRVALRLALHAPERVSALVLESASPGIEDSSEREERVRSDGALADSIERDGIEAFVDRWQAQPLFATQARLPETVRNELRRQRLSNDPIGLANSLRGMGAGAQEPVLDRLSAVNIPTLLLVGEEDENYCALARRMAAALPCSKLEIVSGAGHTVHLEQPDAFASNVQKFLTAPRQARKEKAS